ncbi:molybdopterin biosynthesis protein MoeB [Exophiala viscosa]|nr:molybdopterin biosynthesis protein MoeB [Exophiala viscosa]
MLPLILIRSYRFEHRTFDVHLIAAGPFATVMRTFEENQRRWSSLFSTSIGVDLRQALRDGEGFDPCEDGLRSVCWKAFLLYGPLSQRSWPKKLAESRSAYVSLRNHFLRFIEHPNDIHSSADPLADDEASPWSTLRQDEEAREEIFQDVTRCMQDNYFFREPATQKQLLDILFIYAKLNPDVGYRQGMHELLAPILWVAQQDAVDALSVPDTSKSAEGVDFMLEVLDARNVEHDAFSLFCALMQTAKAFYEIGESRDSSPIIERSKRIHDGILASIDPELALHMNVIGILPQIYSIRWIRLLFGREFEFQDVLRIWDLLFAENLRPEIIDLTCVAMLLRCRWSLIEADYTTAITSLTHYTVPGPSEPRSLVKDAIFLGRNQNTEAGATVIQHYTGRRPKQSDAPNSRSSSAARTTRTQHRHSPSASPGRLAASQKQLEGLFQEVTGGLQKRTEGWNVSKAVRSAVGEVRRGMNNYQTSQARQAIKDPLDTGQVEETTQTLQRKLQQLQDRNALLAKLLEDAVDSLRSVKLTSKEDADATENNLNISLAKIQFVSVYLSDPEIPIPNEEHVQPSEDAAMVQGSAEEQSEASAEPEAQHQGTVVTLPVRTTQASGKAETASTSEKDDRETHKGPSRPSLMDASFSFMLGENRHRSSFVSSAGPLPEQRRDSSSRGGPKQTLADAKTQQARNSSKGEDDSFTLTKLQGAK